MLNYIKAELWKVFRRKSCYVLAALLLFCAHLYGWLFSGGYFADLAAGVSLTMVTGMPLAPLLAHLVDAGSRDTLKNELSFGLSRGRIYWGKLAAGLLLGLLLALILVGGVLATGRLLLPRGDPGAAWSNLYRVGVCLLGAVPLWCGMFALCHTLALLVRSTAVWMAGYYVAFFIGQPILTVLAAGFFGGNMAAWPFRLLQAVLIPCTLLISGLPSGWISGEYLLWCWGVGLGWLAVSAGAGLLVFRRMDLR